MSNANKIKLSEWISFGISTIGILLKLVKEIIEIIPEKGEIKL